MVNKAKLFVIFLFLLTLGSQCFASLRQVAMLTLATNPRVLEANNQLQANHYLKWQAVGRFLPKLDYFLSRGKERTIFNEDDPIILFPQQKDIVLEQPVFEGFDLVGNYHNAAAAEKAQLFEYLLTRRQVLLEAVESYINIIRDRRLVQLAKNNIAIHLKTLYRVKRRYQAGVGNRSDVALAKARLALAHSQYITLQAQYQEERVEFYTITGTYPKVPLAKPRLPTHLLPHNLDEALIKGLRNSFEIKRAHAQIKESKAEITISKSDFYPHVNAEFTKEKERDLAGIKQSENNLRAQVNISYNLFDGTSDYAGVKAARHVYYSNIDNAVQVEREVHNNISRSWIAMFANKADEQKLKIYVKYAARVSYDFKIQFTVGKRALFNVLDSEQELFRARVAKTNATYDYEVNFYRLYAAMSELLPVVMQTH